MQSTNEVLSEEIRALRIEKSLSGYVMACCMEDVPEEEMRELLFARVLSMTGQALEKAEKRSGVVLSETGSEHLHVIAEEVSRVAALCIGQDIGTLGTTKSFMEMEAGCVN